MNTKLKINIVEGLLEVEGSETFVNSIYEDFKGNLLQNKTVKPISTVVTEEKPTKTPVKKTKQTVTTKGKKKAKSKTPSIISSLNLRPKDQSSLDDFTSNLNIKSNLERNVAFVYYLTHELKTTNIGLDHIYTCYRHLKAKVPAAFYQSIADTSVKGWIDTSDTADITLTSIGLNYVEHDMQPSN
ncbi:hypothetical protein [Roseivirga sp.]|uniref:hypothetical protein n=1 Tax=Roseivirga sp. TaxID=1964215 RepID=UPI002B271E4F|nr:hypothetical protein [Roseivirga sp.]